MKIKKLIVLLLALVFTACNKESNNSIRSAAVSTNSVEFTDTVKIPINDLGTGTYRGFTGGLYPGGVNTPSGQYKRDLKNFAMAIRPLSGGGVIDSTVGKIAFISIGGSVGGRNMLSLKDKTTGNPATNPFLKLVNCNTGKGDASLNSIMNPNDPYWDHVSEVIITSHITRNQVQVVYLETEDSVQFANFPSRPRRFRDDLEQAVRTCKIKFTNLKIVYVLGRTTTWNKQKVSNTEPCPYYNGWGEKFMIEDQINGKKGTAYKGDSAVAPMVTWGWYQWADGSDIPRQDGFTWQESDTQDGMHATDAGQDTLSGRFQNFLLTDFAASIWYANHTRP